MEKKSEHPEEVVLYKQNLVGVFIYMKDVTFKFRARRTSSSTNNMLIRFALNMLCNVPESFLSLRFRIVIFSSVQVMIEIMIT